MDLLFTEIVSKQVLQAICRVLIHSLWQGLIAAVITGAIVSMTKRSAASVRYNLLVGVLVLFVLGVTVTAGIQLISKPASETVAIGGYAKSNGSLILNSASGQRVTSRSAETSLLDRFNSWCNEHASVIVLVWFLIFMLKCCQLAAGLLYLQRLRYRNNRVAGTYWKEKLAQLANEMGIRRSIMFLESELVKVPAAIGFMKPVLLVPIGLLSNLPPEQVEAILIHELAHIRRKDFFVNILQSIVETFFFFNPAVSWITSLVREEREACCDDMVIARIPQKTSYLQALVSFQQQHASAVSVALTGNKHFLLNRVRRMLTLENKKLNIMEKTVLLLSIIGITAFSFIAKGRKEFAIPTRPFSRQIEQASRKEFHSTVSASVLRQPGVKDEERKLYSMSNQEMDTVPRSGAKPNADRTFPSISSNINNDGNRSTSEVNATDNEGKQYRIKRVDGKITELSINGTGIPEQQYGEYQEVINRIDKAQRERSAKQKEEAERRKELILEKQKELAEKNELREEMQRERSEQNEEKKKRIDQKIELQKAGYDQKKAEVLQNQDLYNQKKAEVLQDQKLYEQRKLEVLKNQTLYNRKAETIENQKLYNQKQRLYKTDNSDIGGIIADLNNQKLVTSTDNLSFKLTDNELVVNGKKQPPGIHSQFKQKYIHNSNDRFIYSRKGSQTSTTINKE